MTPTTTFIDKSTMAMLAANMLLEIEAVRFYDGEPFQTTSGWATPVYTDCRKLISYPRIRTTLMDFLTATIMRDIGFESLDGIAGGETAGIPFAAWVSDRMGLPMQYVRKKPKGFGRKAQIEGDFNEGDHILLVEDMTTDGQSKITFCNALRAAGAVCDHTAVVFYYDIFPHSKRIFGDNNITLHYLTTWWDVLKAAKAKNVYDANTLAEVEKFLNDPISWSGAHGGLSAYPE